MKAKTESKKPTPESELKAMVNKLDPKTQKLFKSVRAAVRKIFPTANELVYDYGFSLVIGYSPSENGIESVVSTSTRGDEVALYFNNGPKLPDPKGILQGSGKATRFIPLESASRLAHPDVKAFIAATIELASVPLRAKGKGVVIIKSTSARKKASAKRKK